MVGFIRHLALTFSAAPGGDLLGIGPSVAGPLLTAAEFLIPAAVAGSGLHKVLTHQEGGGGFLVDMVLKAGGAVLIIELIKAISGL